MRGLAYRRHNEEKAKAKAAVISRVFHGVKEPDASRIGKVAHTRVVCSGPCCGNPRRHFGKMTMQERRSPAMLND
ncbi:hypothetical protein [Paracoccus versutus]|uniref:hypothetical protein n=1 Tax=Paracoccus versutus TaxID=34007 RepID=UPI0011C04198|nr:hypothetical protein [Paracoccus versutus]WGR55647.1 hypothetical protein E3U25_06615 [Paracoccus versutus]